MIRIHRIPSRQFSTNSSKKKIGFLGLGNMGAHMAHNLMKAGHPLVIYDVVQPAVNKVQSWSSSLGLPIQVAKSPIAVSEHADTIITMLPNPTIVNQVYCGNEGLLQLAKDGYLFIDSSTIDPTTARNVITEASKKGAKMVDAPVSGGVGGAEAGTLTFMVGGSGSVFNEVQPILKLMGKNIVHCGDSGAGQAAKICNNLVLGISMGAVAEGMNLGVKLGLDPKVLAGIFNTSSGRCWSSDTYNPCPGVMEKVPASRNYEGGFGVDLLRKDVGLALKSAQEVGQSLPLGELINSLYDNISHQGYGQKDFSFIYEFLRVLQAQKDKHKHE